MIDVMVQESPLESDSERGPRARRSGRRSAGRHRTLSVGDALHVGIRVLRALDHARGHGIIHRDVKPQNVMLCRREVKVMDFGLARQLEPGHKTTLVAGTPRYMAPEQFAGKGLDERTDLFGFGVTLFETLAGRLPYPEGVAALGRAAVAPRLGELRPDVPAELAQVVHRCVALAPAERYPKVNIALAQLEALRERLEGAVVPTAAAFPPAAARSGGLRSVGA